MDNDDKLKLLGQTATDVPERLAVMQQLVSHFSSQAQQYSGEFEQLQSELQDRIEAAETELRSYLEEGQQFRTQLREEADQVQQTLSSLTERWGAGSAAMTGDFEQLQTQLSQLDSQIDTVTGQVTEVVNKVQSSEEQIEQLLGSAQEVASSTFEDLRGEMSSFQEILLDIQDESQAKVEELAEGLEEQQDALEAKLQNLTSELGSLVEKFEDFLTDTHLEILAGGVENLSTAIRQKIEAELKEIIRDALHRVTELLEDLVEKITGSKGDTAAVRELIKPIIDEIDDLLAPLEGLIDAVKSVAGVFSAVTSIF